MSCHQTHTRTDQLTSTKLISNSQHLKANNYSVVESDSVINLNTQIGAPNTGVDDSRASHIDEEDEVEGDERDIELSTDNGAVSAHHNSNNDEQNDSNLTENEEILDDCGDFDEMQDNENSDELGLNNDEEIGVSSEYTCDEENSEGNVNNNRECDQLSVKMQSLSRNVSQKYNPNSKLLKFSFIEI